MTSIAKFPVRQTGIRMIPTWGGGFGGVEFGGFQRRGEATEKNTDVGSKTEVEQLEGFLFSYISN